MTLKLSILLLLSLSHMYFGTSTISSAKIGETDVSKVYKGEALLWQASHPTFSFEHVSGLGGNFAGEPQGLGFNVATQMMYAMSNNSGARQVKKINLSGTTLVTNSNQGGSSDNIQDGAVHDSKVYVPRGTGTPGGAQTGSVQIFDLDLNFIEEIDFPMARYATAITFKHGYWWASCYDWDLYQISEDWSEVIAIHDISGGTKTSPFNAYGGMDWYGKYLFGTDHDLGSQIQVWYLESDGTVTLVDEIPMGDYDINNGLAFDEVNQKLYASSRTLADDIQVYNVIIE